MDNGKELKRNKRPRISKSSKNKKEDLKELVERRNKRLNDFFKLFDLNIRIAGDENSPFVLLDEKYVLNCFVHNFELRFTDSPFQGNVIYVVKLTQSPKFDKNIVLNCINDYPKREIFKVCLKNSTPELFLCGYNFLNKEEGLGRYPVFSSYNPKIYFTEEKAKEVMENIKSDGYNVIIC